MAWHVEVYCDEVDERRIPVVEEEALALIEDAEAGIGTARLVGWLQAVALGTAAPTYEPSTSADGTVCRFRCDGHAVIIFELVGPERLLLLRFGRAVNALPAVADLALAVKRLQTWKLGRGQ